MSVPMKATAPGAISTFCKVRMTSGVKGDEVTAGVKGDVETAAKLARVFQALADKDKAA